MAFWTKKDKASPTKAKTGPHSKRFSQKTTQLIDAFESEYFKHKQNARYYVEYKDMKTVEDIAKLTPEERAEFLLAFAHSPPILRKTKKNDYQPRWFVTESYGKMMRRKSDFKPEHIAEILTKLNAQKYVSLSSWPVGLIMGQLEKSLKNYDLSEETTSKLLKISEWKAFSEPAYYGTDMEKARLKLLKAIGSDDPQFSMYPLGGANIGEIIKSDLDKMTEEQRVNWYQLFQTAGSASGSKPTKKFTTAMNADIETIGVAKFKSQVRDWLEKASGPKSFHKPGEEDATGYGVGTPPATIQNLLKGLVWPMVRFHDEKTVSAIAKLTEKCFDRLPGVGPAAAGLGNACILTLANSKGLSGVSHLSRLKLRIKQNNTQKMIQKHIEAQAEKQGLKAAEIEDMAAPDFGLEQGHKSFEFKDYTLQLDATRVGQASLRWMKPDGNPQKTVPSFIKDSAPLKRKLADVRALVKEIKKASTAQRDRIDRLYTEDMSWSPETFEKYYLNHGLIGPQARKLVWMLTIGGKQKPALYHDNEWQDHKGKPIAGEIEKFQLWHPIMSETKQVLAWRDRLETQQIKQPFKQTFREVYLLTDAEVNTKVYSNRMAAHILKQHQFNALAAIRGWKYSLQGAYDDGRDNEVALKPLPAYGLTAEFWIDELLDENDSFNDAGIWDYVATDQVRFKKPGGEQHVDLIDIPPIILSEILRDADLFVGVASVGNDPTWADRGTAERTRNYWHSYSFGDLNETAKTRKTVLENLLPRLKIRDKARIEGKFLIVNGTRHSYKIHIGSGNILIMPSDQYLCIVPGRGKDKNVDALYLPFEGDRGLSIVLSKAFMLAEDDKIKDTTILSQL